MGLRRQAQIAVAREAPLAQLRELVATAFEDVGRVVSEGRAPVPWPSIAARLTELSSALTPPDTRALAARIALLIGRLANDLTGMLGAAGYDRVRRQAVRDIMTAGTTEAS